MIERLRANGATVVSLDVRTTPAWGHAELGTVGGEQQVEVGSTADYALAGSPLT